MRFKAKRSERHRLCAESPHNRIDRLNFLQRNRGRRHRLQQVAQKHRALALRQFLESGKFPSIRRAHVRMHAPHNFRRISVQLRALSEAIQPRVRQFDGSTRKRRAVHAQIIAKQIVQALLSGKIGGILEKLGADLFRKPDNLKQMAIAIARQRRDSHAR